jgi:hypothetical protein
MKTTDIRISDLPAQDHLKPEELEGTQGGRSELDLTKSPLADKYLPTTTGVWVREYVEDVEAY